MLNAYLYFLKYSVCLNHFKMPLKKDGRLMTNHFYLTTG